MHTRAQEIYPNSNKHTECGLYRGRHLTGYPGKEKKKRSAVPTVAIEADNREALSKATDKRTAEYTGADTVGESLAGAKIPSLPGCDDHPSQGP